MSLRIAILYGGPSSEAAVSERSAQAVKKGLETLHPDIITIRLEKNFLAQLSDFEPDVIFPALHGPPGEDGTLQGFLEILGYPYVGSSVKSSAIAMDKIVAKQVFRKAGLPLAKQIVVARDTKISDSVQKILTELGSDVVVKPSTQGSALGVTLIEKTDEIQPALEKAFGFDSRILVEERINGREITVGIIETDYGVKPFPVIEIITPRSSWYDYEHRYTKGLSNHRMPADIAPDLYRNIQDCAIEAHISLGCRDLSRADFLLDGNKYYLLETNTLPGMTETSLYPEGAEGFGLPFPELLDHLVRRAAKRLSALSPA